MALGRDRREAAIMSGPQAEPDALMFPILTS
jgi:hypothetical protein